MKRRKPSTLRYGPNLRDLRIVAAKLNARDEAGAELRSLTERWKASGPNLQKMMNADVDLWHDLQEALPAHWLPTRGARAHYVPLPGIGHDNDTPVRKARLFFAFLVLNPNCDLLSGPCIRCHRYFVKRTQHTKVYCSPKCGHAATAKEAMQTRRANQRRERLQWVHEAIAEWAKRTRREDWKTFAIRHVSAKHRVILSERFLSRWSNPKNWTEDFKLQVPQPH